MFEIYVDGSCKGNGKTSNTGGFGVVVIKDNELIDIYSKQSENTTNNREELKAILYTILNYGKIKEVFNPTVYSDSAYCVNTFTEWMYNWADNNWLKSNNKSPENLDLIKAYYNLCEIKGFKINLKLIKGHSKIVGNELADQLATNKIKTFKQAKIFWDNSK